MDSKAKGTMILRHNGVFYKVLRIIGTGDNSYTFECIDLERKRAKTLKFHMTGILEAYEQARKHTKTPRDIFFLDIDRNGDWEILTEEQLEKL